MRVDAARYLRTQGDWYITGKRMKVWRSINFNENQRLTYWRYLMNTRAVEHFKRVLAVV